MNHENEFDELARRKLEARGVPFEEGHWKQMEAVLAAERGNKGRGAFWIWGSAALLVTVAGVWWFASPTSDTQLVKRVEVVQNNEGTTTGRTPNATVGVGDPIAESNEVILEDSIATPTGIRSQDVTIQVGTGSTVMVERGSVAKAAGQVDRKREGRVAKQAEARTATRTSSAEDEPKRAAATTTTPGTKVPVSAIVENPFVVLSSAVAAPDTDRPTRSNDQVEKTSDPMNDGSKNRIEGNAVPLNTGTDQAPSTAGTLSPDEIAETVNAYDVVQEAPAEEIGTPAVPVITSDETTDSSQEVAKNDTVTTTPTPEAMQDLITPKSPWEISILGGAMSTNTSYSGGNSANWNKDVQGEWSANAGAELMHMGRNFGLGTGVHYGTYSEQLTTSPIDRSTWNTRNFWFLSPLDTTILFITDTITIDSMVYHVGQSVPTTINILMAGTDSTYSTTRIRDGRSVVNKVSYVEIPLLLDAHLVQGRWNIGLRGGPTIGLLTGRKGSLPNTTDDGYTSFNDQPFREVVLGWTARAYVRYRFNAAWSIGVEPMMRGQFNSLGDGDISRRTSAFGGQLSLSYRLR